MDSSADVGRLMVTLGLDPVIIGATAAMRYRLEPRATVDVDYLVRRLDGLVEALGERGLDTRVVRDDAGAPYLVIIHGAGVDVDVLLAETDYQRTAIDRAVDGALSVEDVIVHKLIAWRAKDRDDIDSILAAGHRLDEAYIEHWATAWDVLDRWREVGGSDLEADAPG